MTGYDRCGVSFKETETDLGAKLLYLLVSSDINKLVTGVRGHLRDTMTKRSVTKHTS